MNTKIVDPLPAGAFTLTGKTGGPAINAGRCRWSKSQMMYVHLDELRDMVVAAGWQTDQAYHLLEGEVVDLADRLADADAKLTEYEDKIETLERALGWKPQEKPTNGKSQRSTAKSTSV